MTRATLNQYFTALLARIDAALGEGSKTWID